MAIFTPPPSPSLLYGLLYTFGPGKIAIFTPPLFARTSLMYDPLLEEPHCQGNILVLISQFVPHSALFEDVIVCG